VDLGCSGVLPLETGLLLGIGVGIVLNGFEDAGSELGTEVTEGSFLFEILNDNVLEVVHLKLYN